MEIFGLDAWLVWFLIGMGLLIVEVAIAFTFYAAPIALGAFGAAIVAALGGGIELQLVAFIIGSLLSLAFLRPLVAPAPAAARRGEGLERAEPDRAPGGGAATGRRRLRHGPARRRRLVGADTDPRIS